MSSKKYFFNQKTSRQENIFLQNYVSSFLDGVLFEHLFLINGFLIKKWVYLWIASRRSLMNIHSLSIVKYLNLLFARPRHEQIMTGYERYTKFRYYYYYCYYCYCCCCCCCCCYLLMTSSIRQSLSNWEICRKKCRCVWN